VLPFNDYPTNGFAGSGRMQSEGYPRSSVNLIFLCIHGLRSKQNVYDSMSAIEHFEGGRVMLQA
jgi:hypothetical protein